MSNALRNTRFILSCAVAGTLSGALYFPFMIRGAIFGAALAGGAIALNPWRRPRSAGPVPRRHALVAALAVSVVAASLINLIPLDKLIDKHRIFPLLNSLTLSTLLLLGYRERHLGESPGLYWFLLAPLLSSAVRMIGFDENLRLSDFLTLSLFGAYPFILLWLLAARLSDPAWTRDRWMQAGRCMEDTLDGDAPVPGDSEET